MERLQLHEALEVVGGFIREHDIYIETQRPWALAKSGAEAELEKVLGNLAETLRHVALMLVPFMPTTAEKILSALGQVDWSKERLTDLQQWGRMKEGTVVGRLEHLFPPLEKNL